MVALARKVLLDLLARPALLVPRAFREWLVPLVLLDLLDPKVLLALAAERLARKGPLVPLVPPALLGLLVHRDLLELVVEVAVVC